MADTKENILRTALRLFARDGYEAVSTSAIAGELGMTKGALYKHYKNKRAIFDSIVARMYEIDAERSQACAVPQEVYADAPESYRGVTIPAVQAFTRAQFRFWTEDSQGEVPGLFPPGIGQTHQAQQLIDPVVGRQAQDQVLLADVLPGRHMQVDSRALHHRSHPAAAADDAGFRIPSTVQSVVALRGLLQAADETDERGFSGAVAPHEAVDGPLWDAHGEAVQGREVPVALCQSPGLQYIFHGLIPPFA